MQATIIRNRTNTTTWAQEKSRYRSEWVFVHVRSSVSIVNVVQQNYGIVLDWWLMSDRAEYSLKPDYIWLGEACRCKISASFLKSDGMFLWSTKGFFQRISISILACVCVCALQALNANLRVNNSLRFVMILLLGEIRGYLLHKSMRTWLGFICI